MAYKSAITNNFNSAYASYTKVDQVQHQSAEQLVGQCRKFFTSYYISSILDIGCGPGTITNLLYQHLPHGHYYLNDVAPNMLATAKDNTRHIPKVQLLLGDIEQLPIEKYDLIISNLCLQWLSDFAKTVPQLFENSQLLSFSTLLSGTFNSWYQLLNDYNLPNVRHNYLTYEQLHRLVAGLTNQYEISLIDYQVNLGQPLKVMRYLKQLGAQSASFNPATDFRHLRQLLQQEKRDCILEYKIALVTMRH